MCFFDPGMPSRPLAVSVKKTLILNCLECSFLDPHALLLPITTSILLETAQIILLMTFRTIMGQCRIHGKFPASAPSRYNWNLVTAIKRGKRKDCTSFADLLRSSGE